MSHSAQVEWLVADLEEQFACKIDTTTLESRVLAEQSRLTNIASELHNIDTRLQVIQGDETIFKLQLQFLCNCKILTTDLQDQIDDLEPTFLQLESDCSLIETRLLSLEDGIGIFFSQEP